MKENVKDFSSYFQESDITLAITEWKQKDRDYSIFFIPLQPHDKRQQGIQKLGDKVSRVDFVLTEKENNLYFTDIIFDKTFRLDLSELNQSVIHLVGQHSIATFQKMESPNLSAF